MSSDKKPNGEKSSGERSIKDYSYRSSWDHFYSRAYNKAKRGGLTKEEMMKKYGRFPKKNEWWLEGITEKEWTEQYIEKNPKPTVCHDFS